MNAGNILIAKYMGAKLLPELNPTMVANIDFPHKPFRSCHIKDLEYHSSWDWLMPVVKKITNTANREDNIWGNWIELISLSNFIEGDINEVYKAVVKYISQTE